MFIVLYDSTTGKITHWKRDNATVPNSSIDTEIACNGKGNPNIQGAEIDVPAFDIEIGKHLFDPTTKAITVDPNWKEPTPPKVSIQGIPSTNTSTGQTVNATPSA